MDHGAAVAVQNAAQAIEGAAHVDVGNIDMLMLVRQRRLLEASPLREGLPFHRASKTGSLQYPPNTRGADRYHVSI